MQIVEMLTRVSCVKRTYKDLLDELYARVCFGLQGFFNPLHKPSQQSGQWPHSHHSRYPTQRRDKAYDVPQSNHGHHNLHILAPPCRSSRIIAFIIGMLHLMKKWRHMQSRRSENEIYE
jgi:hypothetical protein